MFAKMQSTWADGCNIRPSLIMTVGKATIMTDGSITPRSGVASVCEVPGCEKVTRSKSATLCHMHYVRLWRTGSIDRTYSERLADGGALDSLSGDKAWMLGLIWTDGCIKRNSVLLTSTDIEALHHVQRLIGGANLIRWARSESGKKPYAQLEVVSAPLAGRIRALGLTERKSLTAQYPKEIDGELFWPFLRGVIDGDGWVSLTKTRPGQQRENLEVGICGGAPDFMRALYAKLCGEGLAPTFRCVPAGKHGRMSDFYVIAFRKQADQRRLYELLYPSPDVPCIIRKRDKWRRWYETPRASAGNPKVIALSMARRLAIPQTVEGS